jgi:undecaprenyl-diphosphatase
MGWEAAVLLRLRSWSSPALDTVFLLSHELGNFGFGTALVLLVCGWHLLQRRPRAALVWFVAGLSTLLLQWQLKLLILRPRPRLWPWLIDVGDPAWPSGHALSTATFFSLLAAHVGQRWPARAWLAWVVAVALVLYVGVGRLYLGVHWPTDVVGGWLLGAVQALLAWRLMKPH